MVMTYRTNWTYGPSGQDGPPCPGGSPGPDTVRRRRNTKSKPPTDDEGGPSNTNPPSQSSGPLPAADVNMTNPDVPGGGGGGAPGAAGVKIAMEAPLMRPEAEHMQINQTRLDAEMYQLQMQAGLQAHQQQVVSCMGNVMQQAKQPSHM